MEDEQADSKAWRAGGRKMTPVDIASAVAGSIILAALFASIAIRRPRRISAVDQDWRKVRVEA